MSSCARPLPVFICLVACSKESGALTNSRNLHQDVTAGQSSNARPLSVLFATVYSTEGRSLISPRHLHQGVTISLEGSAVGDSKALAVAVLTAQLAHEGRHYSLIAFVQGCVYFIQQEQLGLGSCLCCLQIHTCKVLAICQYFCPHSSHVKHRKHNPRQECFHHLVCPLLYRAGHSGVAAFLCLCVDWTTFESLPATPG